MIGGAFLAFSFILAAITALYLGETNEIAGPQRESVVELPSLIAPTTANEPLYEVAGAREYEQPGRPRLSMDIVVLPPVTRERVKNALVQAETEARAARPDVTAILLFAFPSSVAQRQGARPIACLEWAADGRGFEGTTVTGPDRRISLEASLLR